MLRKEMKVKVNKTTNVLYIFTFLKSFSHCNDRNILERQRFRPYE